MGKLTGFKGISFPFRISSQGGVVMTTTDIEDITHIEEGILQLLGTKECERPMECDIFSSLEELLFEPNDEALQALIKDEIISTLSTLEDRIEIDESGITFDIVEDEGTEYLYINLTYLVLTYSTYYTTSINIGEV